MRKLRNICFAVFLCFIAMGILLTGCAGAEGSGTGKTNNTENDDKKYGEIVYLDEDEGGGVDLTAVDTDTDYLITSIDKKEKLLAFCRVDSDKSYQFRYDNATVFLNKYGDYITVDELRRGQAVFLGETDSKAHLTLVRIADDVWYHEDLQTFEVHADEGYILIGQEKYRIKDTTRIFWRTEEVEASDISKNDTLAVTGKDRDVYSIRITRGHGNVVIYNTETFVGGWINLGNDIYSTIPGDMEFELPHGVYMLTVANNGWGDTKKIKVEAGKTTKVDLEEYRGEGPEVSTVTFDIAVAEAVVSLDGEEIDYSEPVEVYYGIHTLSVKAKGYERWEHKMVVHSKEAEITIGPSDLTEDGTPKGVFPEESEESEESEEAGQEDETGGEDEDEAGAEGDENGENAGNTGNNGDVDEEEGSDDASQARSTPAGNGVNAESGLTDEVQLETLRELLRSILEEE